MTTGYEIEPRLYRGDSSSPMGLKDLEKIMTTHPQASVFVNTTPGDVVFAWGKHPREWDNDAEARLKSA